MNNKGFSLVELLASMVILGLLMAVIVPNTTGILRSSKANVYLNDAKKMINTAKYRLNTKNEIVAPYADSSGIHCTLLSLAYLDNSNFNTTPYDGCYDVNRSFVLIALAATGETYKDSNNITKNYYEYKYYVQLVEYKNTNYYGILKFISEDDLDQKSKVTLDKSTFNSYKLAYTNDETAIPTMTIGNNTFNTTNKPTCNVYNKANINNPDGLTITDGTADLNNKEKICAIPT